MKKLEVFTLVLGIVGLLADVITVSVFFSQKVSGESTVTITPATQIMIAGFLIYGWFIISWTLVRRNWLKSIRKKAIWNMELLDMELLDIDLIDTDSLTRYRAVGDSDYLAKMAGIAISAIGTLLIPLQWLYLSLLLPIDDPIFYDSRHPTNKIQWFMFIFLITIVSLFFIASLIFISIMLLMPTLYEDMNDLHDF